MKTEIAARNCPQIDNEREIARNGGKVGKDVKQEKTRPREQAEKSRMEEKTQ